MMKVNVKLFVLVKMFVESGEIEIELELGFFVVDLCCGIG